MSKAPQYSSTYSCLLDESYLLCILRIYPFRMLASVRKSEGWTYDHNNPRSHGEQLEMPFEHVEARVA